jgi:hypothetical protein
VGLAPYLQECLVEDVATGIQLITAADSWAAAVAAAARRQH